MHLFVYGTLLSNISSSMSKFLSRRATLVGKATVSGNLYDLGSYPGFVADDSTGTVTGELYHLSPNKEAQTIEMLDAYEAVTGEPDDEYRRITVRARVGGGGSFTAETYEYLGDITDKRLIPRGDYPPYYAQQPTHQKFVNG